MFLIQSIAFRTVLKVPKKSWSNFLLYFCVFSIWLFQGMLFTQINTDDFQLAAGSLLDQFRVLIAKSPLPLSADRLVQIMALNMYSIEVCT
jgi:nitrate/nitrite transporter NarK